MTGIAGLDEQLRLRQRALPALQLDRADPGVLDEPGGAAQGLYGAFLVRAEGEVADDQGALGAPYDGRGQDRHLVERDRYGRLVAEMDVAHRVPDEHDRDAGLVEDGRGHRVVGGEHGPLLAAALGGGDVVDGDATVTGAGAAVQRLGVAGGILRSLERHGLRLLRHLEAP